MIKKKISIYFILLILGAVLPFLLETGLNLSENMFLLMHIPVFLIGLTYGSFLGILSGIIIPALYIVFRLDFENIIMLPFMAVPLLCYGGVSGFLYLKKKKNIYYSMGISVIVGRILYVILFLVYKIAFKKFDGENVFLNLVYGLPGILIQFALVPVFSSMIYKKINLVSKKILENGLKSIEDETMEFMLIRNNRTVLRLEKQSIREIVKLYDEEPSFYRDAVVILKNLGKDTAIILALGGAKAVYAKNISHLGLDTIKQNKIFLKYESVKDLWHDPFEKHLMEITNPAEGYLKIKSNIEASENEEA